MVSKAIARYKVGLDAHVDAILTQLLEEATFDSTPNWFRVRVPSELAHERLDNLIEVLSVPGPVASQIGTIYRFPGSTYHALWKHYGLAARKWQEPPTNVLAA